MLSAIIQEEMRKLILCTIFILSSIIAWGQETNNFSVKDGGIVWQRVYQSQLDSSSIASALIATGQVTDVAGIPGGIVCHIAPRSLDYRGAGYSRGAAAMYIVNRQMEGHATIQLRDGRYRVTVDRMVFVASTETSLSRVGERTPLEDYAMSRKGEIKSVFTSMNASGIIDYDLGKLFDFKVVTDEEDW